MKTVSMFGIVTVCLLSGLSCRGGVVGQRHSTLEPFLGSVDVPKRGSALQGPTVIAGGWALAEDGVQRVEIYIDKQFVTYATLGGDRPDIAKLFPSFPNPGKSGWNAVVDVSSLTNGDHELVAQIKSKAGNVHELPPTPFRVAHDNK